MKISLLAWLVSTGRRRQAWLGRLAPVGGVPASRIPPPIVGFQASITDLVVDARHRRPSLQREGSQGHARGHIHGHLTLPRPTAVGADCQALVDGSPIMAKAIEAKLTSHL